jgi:hypothetical protein
LVVKFSADSWKGNPYEKPGSENEAPNLLLCDSFETELSLLYHFAETCERPLGVVMYPLVEQKFHECFLRVLLTAGLLGAQRIDVWEDVTKCLRAKVPVAIGKFLSH